jgi:hypothetical protein
MAARGAMARWRASMLKRLSGGGSGDVRIGEASGGS